MWKYNYIQLISKLPPFFSTAGDDLKWKQNTPISQLMLQQYMVIIIITRLHHFTREVHGQKDEEGQNIISWSRSSVSAGNILLWPPGNTMSEANTTFCDQSADLFPNYMHRMQDETELPANRWADCRSSRKCKAIQRWEGKKCSLCCKLISCKGEHKLHPQHCTSTWAKMQ